MALTDKFDAIDPNELIDFLIERKRFLPKEVRDRLRDNFSSSDEIVGGGDFDLHREVVDQLQAVKALRKAAISTDGTLEVGIREAKESLAATTSLLTLLTKLQGEIYNQDRIRRVQKITIEVLQEVAPEVRDRFITLLEERLEVKR
jgi:hypothetical protein